jgi:hypothetical protein
MKNKFKISREVLLQLANNNSYSEEILKKECPKLFESEIEINNYYWVKHENLQNSLVFIQGKEVEYTYGFNHYFEWTEIYRNNLLHTKYKKDIIKKATPQEVETALIKEAKNRGYVDGNYKCLRGETKQNRKRFYYNLEMNELRIANEYYYNVIFQNGTWATIIETPTDIITIVEKYGKDKVISLIEKM